MSTNPPNDPLSAIDLAATAAESIAESKPDEQRITDLESQLAKIEPLLEQLQKNSDTAVALSNYVGDLRDEQVFFNRARYVLAAFAAVVIILLIALLWIAIWNSKSPLLKAPPGAIAAFVLGVISGVVYLITSFAKGVFRSTAERHADGFLPPALEKGLEIYNKVTKGG